MYTKILSLLLLLLLLWKDDSNSVSISNESFDIPTVVDITPEVTQRNSRGNSKFQNGNMDIHKTCCIEIVLMCLKAVTIRTYIYMYTLDIYVSVHALTTSFEFLCPTFSPFTLSPFLHFPLWQNSIQVQFPLHFLYTSSFY